MWLQRRILSKIYQYVEYNVSYIFNDIKQQLNTAVSSQGDEFTVKFHREMLVYAPPIDKSTHQCSMVTGHATLAGNLGVT